MVYFGRNWDEVEQSSQWAKTGREKGRSCWQEEARDGQGTPQTNFTGQGGLVPHSAFSSTDHVHIHRGTGFWTNKSF
jgi:hypothetical protein